MQERMERLIEQSGLPIGLHKVSPRFVTKGVQMICNNVFSGSGFVYLYGIGRGKTTNAVAILLSYLNAYRDCVTVDNVGLFVSSYELCLHNRNRYGMDAWLSEQMDRIKTCGCLVIDDVASCLVQQDDLLLQTIYSMRQYCGGITVITTSAESSFDCSGSVLQRFEKNAAYKEEFK